MKLQNYKNKSGFIVENTDYHSLLKNKLNYERK